MTFSERVKAVYNDPNLVLTLFRSIDSSFDDRGNPGLLERAKHISNRCKDSEETLLVGARRFCEAAILSSTLESENKLIDEIVLKTYGSPKTNQERLLSEIFEVSGRTKLQSFLAAEEMPDSTIKDALLQSKSHRTIDLTQDFTILREKNTPVYFAIRDSILISDVQEKLKNKSFIFSLENVFLLKGQESLARSYLGRLMLVLKELEEGHRMEKQANGYNQDSETCLLRVKAELREFLCEVVLQSGFLAPAFLIAGLMSQYDEDWGTILEDFEKQLQQVGDNGNYQQLQYFTYCCWLLWGPSIRLPKTSGKRPALQYGFGDECNSYPVVFSSNDKELYVAALDVLTHRERFPVGAIKCSRFKGRLTAFTTELATNCELPEYQMPDKKDSKKLLVPDLALKAIEIEWDQVGVNSNHYYSAYVWVAFVECIKGPTVNVRHPKNTEPWKGIIPIFEHGNLADPETYAACKMQLAYKAMATFEALFQSQINVPSFSIEDREFVYVCASDDDGTRLNYQDDSNCHLIAYFIQQLLDTKFTHLKDYVNMDFNDIISKEFQGQMLPGIVRSQADRMSINRKTGKTEGNIGDSKSLQG